MWLVRLRFQSLHEGSVRSKAYWRMGVMHLSLGRDVGS